MDAEDASIDADAAPPTEESNMKQTLTIALIATLLASPLARAGDASVAKVVQVSGNVLVSDESNIATAGEALRLVPGMRVLATANSSATIEYAGGCRVRVSAGERFEVRATSPCGAIEQVAMNDAGRVVR